MNKVNLKVIINKSELNLKFIHHFLANESYWAKGALFDEVKQSVENSLCFGLFLNNEQIGFARLITDGITFGFLCDVFIAKEHRGNGYVEFLINYIMTNSVAKNIKKILLITDDAHKLYEKFNFQKIKHPEKFMTKNK